MKELNINNYLGKQDGDTLPASDWNGVFGLVQNKVNELVQSTNDGSIIADGSITADMISSSAVTSAKIADGAVTTDKINDGAITINKFDNNIKEAIETAAASNVQVVEIENYCFEGAALPDVDKITYYTYNNQNIEYKDTAYTNQGVVTFVKVFRINNNQYIVFKLNRLTYFYDDQYTKSTAPEYVKQAFYEEAPNGSITLAKLSDSAITNTVTEGSSKLISSGGVYSELNDTKTTIINKFDDYAKKNDVSDQLQDYATTAELEDRLTNYSTIENVDAKTQNLATKSDVNTKVDITTYNVDKSNITSKFDDYVKKTKVNDYVDFTGYATKNDVEECDARIDTLSSEVATKASASDYTAILDRVATIENKLYPLKEAIEAATSFDELKDLVASTQHEPIS